MVGLSYEARNVLSYTRRILQHFLAFRDSPIIPLGRSRSPSVCLSAVGKRIFGFASMERERKKERTARGKAQRACNIFHFLLLGLVDQCSVDERLRESRVWYWRWEVGQREILRMGMEGRVAETCSRLLWQRRVPDVRSMHQIDNFFLEKLPQKIIFLQL